MLRSINFFQRYRDPLLVVCFVVVPLVIYTASPSTARPQTLLDRALVQCTAPLQWLVAHSLRSWQDVWHAYFALVETQAQNVVLRAENARLRAALDQREEARHENARLRRLVALRWQTPQAEVVFAEVIGTSPSPLFRSLRINRGRQHGIALGAAVVRHDGVVGRVAAVAEHAADVMLLVDNNSSIDVLVQRTRVRGRVRGQGGDGQMGIEVQYLTRTANVEPGDVLITSGLGKTFPKGLRVGTVEAVESHAFGLYQHASVRPSVDFRRLESVMVILSDYPADTSFELPATSPLAMQPLPWQNSLFEKNAADSRAAGESLSRDDDP